MISRILKIDENKTHNDLWRGEDEKIDVILFMNIFIPILSVVIMHSSLYTGWRHMFFIYPSIVFFIIYSIKMINILYVKNKHKLIVLSIIFLLPTIFWMYKNHPYQYTYFNSIYKKNFNKYFDMDYWGLTNYHSMKYILKNNKQNTSSSRKKNNLQQQPSAINTNNVKIIGSNRKRPSVSSNFTFSRNF